MNGALQSLINCLIRVIRKPGFWIILALFVLITFPHYYKAFEYPVLSTYIIPGIGLTRHTLERILYLVPIVWAGFLFGFRGTTITSLAALVCMLPRAFFISPNPTDAIAETGAVLLTGSLVSGLLAFSSRLLRREREHLDQLEVMQQNLRFYLQQGTRAQEEERKRISHELHDDTIQALVVLSRQLDALSSSDKGLSEENRLRLEELWQQTDNILRGVRRLSQDLRPAELDRLGLLPALEWLTSNVTEYSGIVAKVNVVGEERRLPEEVAIALFRITQEALRNVWRHSEASRAEITIEFDQNKVSITVSDNGKGFSPPQSMGDLAKDGKLGLAGMQERARLIGGTLSVESQLGKGSIMTIEIST